MSFNEWLDKLVEEKGYDVEDFIFVEGESGVNIISLAVVLETIKNTCLNERKKIKSTLVKIDFLNGDCLHFFKYLAKALAV